MPDVVVNATRGRIVLRAVPASSTIAALKDRLAAHRDCGRPATWIQLRHRGTLLDDTVTLAAQGISQWTLDMALAPPSASRRTSSSLGPGMTEADERVRLREVFRSFDADGSGKIDVTELWAALRQSGVDVEQAEAEAVLARLDTLERDGQLDFEEFSAAFQQLEEISVLTVRQSLLGIHSQIREERRAKAAAQAAEAAEAAKIQEMERELAAQRKELSTVEAGLHEMALGKPGGQMVSKSHQRQREGAVCRVLHPTKGVGTGFLAAIPPRLLPESWATAGRALPSVLLMTNNHVLRSASEAVEAFAELDYEEDKTPFEVSLRPSEFFLTCEELDYTLVAVDESELRGRQPVPLRAGLGVGVGAVVTVTQHPGGRMKMAANQVVKEVCPPFVRYVLDTEYGSSGSPVFMNMSSGMEVVAVHHQRSPKDAANQGVLLAVILDDVKKKLGGMPRAAGERPEPRQPEPEPEPEPQPQPQQQSLLKPQRHPRRLRPEPEPEPEPQPRLRSSTRTAPQSAASRAAAATTSATRLHVDVGGPGPLGGADAAEAARLARIREIAARRTPRAGGTVSPTESEAEAARLWRIREIASRPKSARGTPRASPLSRPTSAPASR